jgi:hypothetical protein
MGEARHNPASAQYRGPLPENILIAGIEAGTVIDPQWLTENKPGLGEEWPAPPDSAVHLQFYLTADWIRPSQLTPREKWPRQKVGITQLFAMTMEEFKELAAAQAASRASAEQGGGA